MKSSDIVTKTGLVKTPTGAVVERRHNRKGDIRQLIMRGQNHVAYVDVKGSQPTKVTVYRRGYGRVFDCLATGWSKAK